VAGGAGAVFGALRRLQIGAEVPRPLDDAIALRQAFRLETAQPGFDIIAVNRRSERRRVVGRL
jgi:hypothetical protein